MQKYCERIENGQEWGSQYEIVAISNALNVAIEVIRAEGMSSLTRADYRVQLYPVPYPRANILILASI